MGSGSRVRGFQGLGPSLGSWGLGLGVVVARSRKKGFDQLYPCFKPVPCEPSAEGM